MPGGRLFTELGPPVANGRPVGDGGVAGLLMVPAAADQEAVGFKLKEGSTLYHGRPYLVPHIHLETLKKEVKRLVDMGVLNKQPESN